MAICEEMNWTEQEFNSQRMDFISDLVTYLEEKNKQLNK